MSATLQSAHGFRLLAQSASTMSTRVDLLFTAMTVLCGLVALGLALTIIVFSVRYRAGTKVDRSNPPATGRKLEVAWILIPLVIFLALFGWAAWDFTQRYDVPRNALPIQVVGKQWMWKLTHANGRREINTLHVPQDRPVQLIMSSEDVIHSFFVPAFRLKQDVLPGRYTTLWFQATEAGDFHLFCAEYCGSDHSGMIGHVVVMPPADYARWVQAGASQPGLANQGFALFRAMGCAGCHGAGPDLSGRPASAAQSLVPNQPTPRMPGSTVAAPLLQGLFGRQVHLQDGSTVVADDNYIRDSILVPQKQVVAGYAPVMPSFAGQLSEDDLAALLAYLKSDRSGAAP